MKLVIWVSITVCGLIGAYLPVILFGAGPLDISSLAGGVIGSIAGVFIGYKIGQNLEL